MPNKHMQSDLAKGQAADAPLDQGRFTGVSGCPQAAPATIQPSGERRVRPEGAHPWMHQDCGA